MNNILYRSACYNVIEIIIYYSKFITQLIVPLQTVNMIYHILSYYYIFYARYQSCFFNLKNASGTPSADKRNS